MTNHRKTTASLGAIGLAVALGLTVALPGSAVLDEGGFKVKAADDENPKITAVSGMGSAEALLPGSGAVVTPVEDRILASYSCGPERFNYTQSMKDLTTANLALHALGKDSEMKKGPGGWESVAIIEKPGMYNDSGKPSTIIMVGDINVAAGTTAGPEMIYGVVHSIPNGSSQSGILGFKDGHNTQGVAYMEASEVADCNYIKSIDGKLSSLDGSPAYYKYKAKDEIFDNGDVSWSTVFAKDGQFYREGGKPQFLRSFSDGPTGKNRIIAEFTYPSGTTIAGSYSFANPQKIEPVRAPFTATPVIK